MQNPEHELISHKRNHSLTLQCDQMDKDNKP